MKTSLILLATVLAVASTTEIEFLSDNVYSNLASPLAGTTNAIIDISSWQGTGLNLAAAKSQGGLLAVICKATQGTGYSDPVYSQYRQQAADAGLLWGAYHFADASDPVSQAEYFLSVAKPDANTLLVLDLESGMSADGAAQFVTHIRDATGRWPTVYGGEYIREIIGGGNSALNSCPLWLSAYVSGSPNPYIPNGWSNWTMWQYTDGSEGPEPHSVPGLGASTDMDVFNGSAGDLESFWTS